MLEFIKKLNPFCSSSIKNKNYYDLLIFELNMSDYLFKPTEGYSEKIDDLNIITFGEEYISDEEMRDICRRAGTYRSEDYLKGNFISVNGGHQHNIALYSKDCPTLADYKFKSIVNDDAICDDEDNDNDDDDDDEYNQFYSDSYDAMYALEEAEAIAEAREMEDIEAEAMAEADIDAAAKAMADELEALEWQRLAEEDEIYRAELEREEREYEEEEYRRRYYPTEEELDEDDYLNDRPSRHLPKSVQRAMIYAQLREEEKRKSGWVRSKYGLF